MTYTPVTCTKAGNIGLRACLGDPFITQHAYLPQRGWNAGQVYISGVDPINGTLAGYINYINDGTDESLFTDLVDPNVAQWGGYYTGAKFMAFALNGGNYSVGVVAHAYTDPDDITAPSMTITNVGNAGTSPPGSYSANDGPVSVHQAGPSEAGGDRISWFEGRTTTMHFLTSDGTGLTREQAFPIDGTEEFRDFSDQAATWIYDGSDFWVLSYILSTSPGFLLLTRFKPTAVGDPYDYEKFHLTLSDSADQALAIGVVGSFALSVSEDHFFVEVFDGSSFGNVRWFKIAKNGTSYERFNITGNAAVTSFATHNVHYIVQNPDGRYRISCPAYTGDGYTVGTYDLLCSGATNQGHCYARKRTRLPRPNDHGFLIPSGDMNDGDDFLITSGDAGGGRFKWQRVQDD